MSGELRTWTIWAWPDGSFSRLHPWEPPPAAGEAVPVVAVPDLVERLKGDEVLVLLLDCLGEAGWYAATEVEMVEAIDMAAVVAKAKADLTGALCAALASLGLDVDTPDGEKLIDLGGPEGGRYWRVVSDHPVDHRDARAAAAYARVTGSVGASYNGAEVERADDPDEGDGG